MTTQFTEVYDFFLPKVEDYSFIDTESYATTEELEAEFYKHLRSAIVRFKQCEALKDRDAVEFKADLDDEEKEILSYLMVLSYITPKIVSTQNMQREMSDREYVKYSQGKHLQEMINLKKSIQLEVSFLIGSYTLNQGLDLFS